MFKGLMSLDELIAKIRDGKKLIISAEEDMLTKLPKGTWIAGTGPYSMSKDGGAYKADGAFVQELPSTVSRLTTRSYTTANIQNVYTDAPEGGFGIIMMPAFTDVVIKFALEAPKFSKFGQTPLMGWVTGTKLDVLGQKPAKVFDGITGESFTDRAIVAHVELPKNMYADVATVNIFDVDPAGDVLQFESDNLEIKDVSVNGKQMNFANYLAQNKADLRWPLVGEYNGVMVNSSFMVGDKPGDTVKMFAPVFRGVNYRLTKPAGDYNAYLSAFRKRVATMPQSKVAVTCNCVFNYLYGELEGKNLDELNGPFVFGEVAYQLHNQTLVYLTIDEKS